jgi:hypothetical protein
MKAAISAELRAAVKARAKGRCEYCGTPEVATLFAHEIDHVIAEQHRGATTLENLAYACFHCNRHKGPNIASIDPESGEVTRLFNPRIDRWLDHFRLQNSEIVALTPVGRATASLLEFNSPQRNEARRALIRVGLWNV